MVTCMEFESMNVALRGQCVKPLHQQAINNILIFLRHYYLTIIYFFWQSPYYFLSQKNILVLSKPILSVYSILIIFELSNNVSVVSMTESFFVLNVNS